MTAYAALVAEARGDSRPESRSRLLGALSDAVEGLVLLVGVLAAEAERGDCGALQRRTVALMAENAALRMRLTEEGCPRCQRRRTSP